MPTPFLRPTASAEIGALALDVSGGDVSLDSGRVPYGQASVEVALVDVADIEDIDPRDDLRVTLTTADDEAGTGRVFDLSLRGRRVDHKERAVTLTLETDEAVLQKYAQLTVDNGARAYESSLRDVIDYALDKIGASLAAGTADADVTAYFPVTNLHPNPQPTSAAGYGAGFGAGAPSFSSGTVRWTPTSTTTDSNLICAGSLTAFRVTPGKTYVFAVEWASANTGRQARAAIQWRNNGSASTLDTVRSALFSYDPSNYQRMHVIATAPAGAEYMYPLVLTSGTAAPIQLVKEIMVYEGDELVPFFSGATTDTADYTFDWADPLMPDASSSVRTPVVERLPSTLSWPADVTAWDFLLPLTAAAQLRLYCDEQRVWHLIDPSTWTKPGLLSVAGWNSVDGTDEITLDDPELVADGVIVRFTWQDEAGVTQTRDDIAGTAGLTRKIELRRPYTPGVAAWVLSRMNGRGRVQDVTALADWTADPGMTATVSLPGTVDQTGQLAYVGWGLSDGLMRIRAATLTDVIPGSIAALTGTIDSLVGTIDAL